LGAFGEAYLRLEELGVALVGISPQDIEHTIQTREELGLPYALLSDKGNEVAGQCGLTYQLPEGLQEIYRGLGIDVPEHNGDDSWVLPIPAVYVIERSGVVGARWIDPDFTRLEDPVNVIRHLEQVMDEA
jgi:peroxiredoxin